METASALLTKAYEAYTLAADWTAAIQQFVTLLEARQREVLACMLDNPRQFGWVGCECLCRMELEVGLPQQVMTAVLKSDDDAAVWLLQLLASHEELDTVPRYVVDRGLRLNGECRQVAISLIPKLDVEEGAVHSWLRQLLETGEERDRMGVVDASLRFGGDIARGLIGRVLHSREHSLVSHTLYRLLYLDDVRSLAWLGDEISGLLDDHDCPSDIVTVALRCVKDHRLYACCRFLGRLVGHENEHVAMEAAEAAALLCPDEAKHWLSTDSVRLAEAARNALRCFFG